MVDELEIDYKTINHKLDTAKTGASLNVIGELVTKITYRSTEAQIKFYVVNALSEDIIVSFMDIIQVFLPQFINISLLMVYSSVLFLIPVAISPAN